MDDYIIFMADVIDSAKKDNICTADELKQLVVALNRNNANCILSPLTITLGDEFQGVAHDLKSAVDLLLCSEQWLLMNKASINLRYVVFEGTIDTPINTESSYGMLGSGLTEARKMLSRKNKDRKIAEFVLHDERKSRLLNKAARAMFGYRDLPARNKHSAILGDLLFSDLSDKEVAEKNGKSPSEIWKYRRNWYVESWSSAIDILKEDLYS